MAQRPPHLFSSLGLAQAPLNNSHRSPAFVALFEPLIDEVEPESIVHRPDGYYWCALDGHQEFGPFDTFDAAQVDRDASSVEAVAPDTNLHEVEESLGIADWLDPETGEPAEGQSPPHLAEE